MIKAYAAPRFWALVLLISFYCFGDLFFRVYGTNGLPFESAVAKSVDIEGMEFDAKREVREARIDARSPINATRNDIVIV